MLYDIVLDLFPLATALIIYFFSGFLVGPQERDLSVIRGRERRSR